MGFLDMGIWEILIVFVVILLVVGPEKLPVYAQKLGKLIRNFRKITSNLTGELMKTVDLEDEAAEVKKTAKEVKEAINGEAEEMKNALDAEAQEIASLKQEIEEEAKEITETVKAEAKEAAESIKAGTKEAKKSLREGTRGLSKAADKKAGNIPREIEEETEKPKAAKKTAAGQTVKPEPEDKEPPPPPDSGEVDSPKKSKQ